MRIPNGITIGSAAFAGLTIVTDRHTDHATPSVTTGRIYLVLLCGLIMHTCTEITHWQNVLTFNQSRLNQRARWARAQGPEPQGAPKHQPMRYFLSREVISVTIFTG